MSRITQPFLAAGTGKAVPVRLDHVGVCHCCGWAGRTLLRAPDTLTTQDNQAKGVCLLCWLWLNLNSQSARQGVLVFLPGLSPSGVVHLQREALFHCLRGDPQQQREGLRILAWLRRHRREMKARWQSTSPADISVLLANTAGAQRAWLQRELTGCAP